MKKSSIFVILLALGSVVGSLWLLQKTIKPNPAYVEPNQYERQARVDEDMRKAGFCRWWMLVHNLPDRAYTKLEQIPDLKFRVDMMRRCPESQPGFIGPQEASYFEDRKFWKKEYGKYPEWNR